MTIDLSHQFGLVNDRKVLPLLSVYFLNDFFFSETKYTNAIIFNSYPIVLNSISLRYAFVVTFYPHHYLKSVRWQFDRVSSCRSRFWTIIRKYNTPAQLNTTKVLFISFRIALVSCTEFYDSNQSYDATRALSLWALQSLIGPTKRILYDSAVGISVYYAINTSWIHKAKMIYVILPWQSLCELFEINRFK